MRRCIRGAQHCNVWTPLAPPNVHISPEARSLPSNKHRPVVEGCSSFMNGHSVPKRNASQACCTAIAEHNNLSCSNSMLNNERKDASSSDDESQTSFQQQDNDFAGTVMTSSDLREYISQHTDLAGVMLVADLDKSSTDPDVIKSLIIFIDGQPAVAILRGADRMDHKKVATAMGVSRQRVRLATRLEAVTACGFVPGTVPPFGHRQPIPTLVDVRLLGLQGLIYAGGGDHNVETAMDVATLVAHTEAQVIDIAVGPPVEFPTQFNSSEGPTIHHGLPLPWLPGAKVVQLVGVVALRRRVAKLLQFCTLVPESTPSLPADGRAMHLRRAWANPDALPSHQHINGDNVPSTGNSTVQSRSQLPLAWCEVQLIMGKTLERNVGREEAIRIMDRIKPGTIIKVIGRTQPHGPPPDYVPTANARSSAARTASTQQKGSTLPIETTCQSNVQGVNGRDQAATDEVIAHHADTSSQQQPSLTTVKPGRPSVVLDVVCHHVEILYRTRDRLEKDLARARRTGQGNPFTACDLLQERQLALAQQTRTSISSLGSVTPSPLPPSQPDAEDGLEEVLLQQQDLPVLDPPSDHSMQLPDTPSTTEPQFWQMGLNNDQDIVWIDDVQGLDTLRQCIAQQVEQYHKARSKAVSSSQLLSALPPPVGLDCEWAPYERNEQATPVALLQVAVRKRVFLVDLLALLQPASQQTSLSPTQDQDTLPPQKRKLGELLSYVLLNPDITALGFQFMQDMSRLVSTYPWLLAFLDPTAVPQQAKANDNDHLDTSALEHARQCLQSALGNTAVNGVQYVDVLRLARAANPEAFLYKFGQPHTMSLSKIVQEVFGLPLDKTCQRSNWDRRPLSNAQRTYAAADSLSLVALHDLLLSKTFY